MFKDNTNVILNSNKDVFLFKLSKDKKITYDMYNPFLYLVSSEVLSDKSVFMYSVVIDKEDNIHLVALMNSGEVTYYKYSEGKWINGKIAKFDLSSNIYNQMELFMINNKLHLIYNYSSLINSNVWTIQHVVYSNKIEAKYNAVRYISKKNPDPFIVDVDKVGTIHLIYKTNMNNSQIFHNFYSPFTNRWTSQVKQLSQQNSNSTSPYLFIDTKDNLHSLWVEEINGKFNTKYSKMNSSGKEKYKWKHISLPYISKLNSRPIIFEENNILKLVFISNNQLTLLTSSNYGNSWLGEKESAFHIKDTILVKFNSNILKDKNKITYGYSSIATNLKFYFLDIYKDIELPQTTTDNQVKSKEVPTDCEYNEVKEEISTDNNEDIVSVISSDIPNMIEELNIQINNIIFTQNSIELILNNILINQKNLENKITNIEDIINSSNKSFFQKLFS